MVTNLAPTQANVFQLFTVSTFNSPHFYKFPHIVRVIFISSY